MLQKAGYPGYTPCNLKLWEHMMRQDWKAISRVISAPILSSKKREEKGEGVHDIVLEYSVEGNKSKFERVMSDDVEKYIRKAAYRIRRGHSNVHLTVDGVIVLMFHEHGLWH